MPSSTNARPANVLKAAAGLAFLAAVAYGLVGGQVGLPTNDLVHGAVSLAAGVIGALLSLRA